MEQTRHGPESAAQVSQGSYMEPAGKETGYASRLKFDSDGRRFH